MSVPSCCSAYFVHVLQKFLFGPFGHGAFEHDHILTIVSNICALNISSIYNIALYKRLIFKFRMATMTKHALILIINAIKHI